MNETTERFLCEHYAASHVVVGMHGSNMLLPSAHAGAIIEIMHPKHFEDARHVTFRHRILPPKIDPDTLAEAVSVILQTYPNFVAYMPSQMGAHHLSLK